MNDYIDNSQEPDFIENEFIYDDIQGLEEMLLDVSFYIYFSSAATRYIYGMYVFTSLRIADYIFPLPYLVGKAELWSIFYMVFIGPIRLLNANGRYNETSSHTII